MLTERRAIKEKMKAAVMYIAWRLEDNAEVARKAKKAAIIRWKTMAEGRKVTEERWATERGLRTQRVRELL